MGRFPETYNDPAILPTQKIRVGVGGRNHRAILLKVSY